MTQRPRKESAETNVDIEAPESDVADQQATAQPDDDRPPPPYHSVEVDRADAAEQDREVEFDEDEYR